MCAAYGCKMNVSSFYSVQKQKLFDLVKMQPGLMFKPKKHHVNAELEQKHYLGKAKVPADIFIHFGWCHSQCHRHHYSKSYINFAELYVLVCTAL